MIGGEAAVVVDDSSRGAVFSGPFAVTAVALVEELSLLLFVGLLLLLLLLLSLLLWVLLVEVDVVVFVLWLKKPFGTGNLDNSRHWLQKVKLHNRQREFGVTKGENFPPQVVQQEKTKESMMTIFLIGKYR